MVNVSPSERLWPAMPSGAKCMPGFWWAYDQRFKRGQIEEGTPGIAVCLPVGGQRHNGQQLRLQAPAVDLTGARHRHGCRTHLVAPALVEPGPRRSKWLGILPGVNSGVPAQSARRRRSTTRPPQPAGAGQMSLHRAPTSTPGFHPVRSQSDGDRARDRQVLLG